MISERVDLALDNAQLDDSARTNRGESMWRVILFCSIERGRESRQLALSVLTPVDRWSKVPFITAVSSVPGTIQSLPCAMVVWFTALLPILSPAMRRACVAAWWKCGWPRRCGNERIRSWTFI